MPRSILLAAVSATALLFAAPSFAAEDNTRAIANQPMPGDNSADQLNGQVLQRLQYGAGGTSVPAAGGMGTVMTVPAPAPLYSAPENAPQPSVVGPGGTTYGSGGIQAPMRITQ